MRKSRASCSAASTSTGISRSFSIRLAAPSISGVSCRARSSRIPSSLDTRFNMDFFFRRSRNIADRLGACLRSGFWRTLGSVEIPELQMAEIVVGIGVPHSPHYPSQIARDGPEPAARYYREIASHLDAARPDAIVVIANDHFNTFFMNNFPTFAIGVADASYGPNDQTKMPRYDFKVQSSLAAHLRNVAIKEGFDLAVTQEFGVDHAMLVPLHYVTDGVKIPVVPIWVNAFVAPLPTARRCYALGQQLRKAIETMPQNLRVAV